MHVCLDIESGLMQGWIPGTASSLISHACLVCNDKVFSPCPRSFGSFACFKLIGLIFDPVYVSTTCVRETQAAGQLGCVSAKLSVLPRRNISASWIRPVSVLGTQTAGDGQYSCCGCDEAAIQAHAVAAPLQLASHMHELWQLEGHEGS